MNCLSARRAVATGIAMQIRTSPATELSMQKDLSEPGAVATGLAMQIRTSPASELSMRKDQLR